MRRLLWSTQADGDYKRYLADLAEAGGSLVIEARDEIERSVDLLTRFPALGRPSLRWQAYREKSLHRWKKVIVYSATDDAIRVHMFVDMRRDLSRVRL